jgi:hypothetical protein
MSVVMIGVDPHKASVSIEARESGSERLLGTGRFGTDTGGYRQLRALVKRWPGRVWAVEGTAGTGRPVAQRLVVDGDLVAASRRRCPSPSTQVTGMAGRGQCMDGRGRARVATHRALRRHLRA